jgi:anti-anti-sigma factor
MSQLRISQEPGSADLVLAGEVDLASVGVLEEALAAAAASGRPISVDLAGVTFIDSTGIQAILRCALSLNGRGPLVIRNPSAMAVRILEIMGIADTPDLEVRSET